MQKRAEQSARDKAKNQRLREERAAKVSDIFRYSISSELK